MFFLENAEIIRNDRVADRIYELECSASGSPVMGSANSSIWKSNLIPVESVSPLLRRPFSLYGVTREQGTISILYRIRGKGTSILAAGKARENT